MAPLPILTHDYVLVNPPSKKFDTHRSVAEYLLECIRQYGDSEAMVHSMTGETITYNEIARRSLALAAALKARGINPGDVVAISSENRLDYISVILGILAVGATCAPLNPIYNTDELLHILSISTPKMIFCSPLTINTIESCRSKLRFIKEIITFGHSNSNLVSYDELIKTPVRSEQSVFSRINPEECVAFLFCSSGTTGLPKCVELTHVNFMCLLNFVRGIWESQPNSGRRRVTMGLIPFFHGYGCTIALESLATQTLTVVMLRFEEKNFLDSIQKYKISHLFIVPPLLVFLSKHPLVSQYDLSSIQAITCGAAPLSKDTQMAAQRRLNFNCDIQQGYGMTELSVCCVAFQSDVKKIGSSGTIAPGMECRVVDLETGKALPPFERGELCFRGPFVMKGYRNNPKATRETFDSEGWFHTGDIGYYDNDGFLFIVDRLKELIKYKGFQVAPAELETILINHPSIKEAGVIGIPNEEAGELPYAFVVRQPGVKISEQDVINYVAGKVSPQKRLRGGVRFVNEIPKNPSGKILRRELRALLTTAKL